MSVVVGALSRHLFQKKVDYPRTFLHLLHKMIKYGSFWRPHRESKTNMSVTGLLTREHTRPGKLTTMENLFI